MGQAAKPKWRIQLLAPHMLQDVENPFGLIFPSKQPFRQLTGFAKIPCGPSLYLSRCLGVIGRIGNLRHVLPKLFGDILLRPGQSFVDALGRCHPAKG